MKKTLSFASVAALAVFCAPAPGGLPHRIQAATQAGTVAACARDQFSLNTDDEAGNFDGMSHSGTLLVLRNLGPNACHISTTPQIVLYGKSGLLNVKFTLTKVGDPRAPSVIVTAGAELTSSLRWVSGDVYDAGVCVQATSLHVTVGGLELSTPINKQMCGQKGMAIAAEMSPLATDPAYRPGKSGEPGS